MLTGIRGHPDVRRAEIAGALRRRLEVVDRAEIVAECGADPVAVAQSFTRLPGVREASGAGRTHPGASAIGTAMRDHPVENLEPRVEARNRRSIE